MDPKEPIPSTWFIKSEIEKTRFTVVHGRFRIWFIKSESDNPTPISNRGEGKLRKQRFGSVFMTPFYQGHKNTTVLSPVFRGQNVAMLQSSKVSKYNDKRSSSEYNMDLKLYRRIRFKFSVFKSPSIKPRIEYDLKVLMSSNGRSSGTFEFRFGNCRQRGRMERDSFPKIK